MSDPYTHPNENLAKRLRLVQAEKEIAALKAKLAAAESACREAITDVEDLRQNDVNGMALLSTYGSVHDAVDKTFERVLVCLKPLRAVLAGEGEALSDEDKADLADALEALKDPGRVPWDDVKKRLGLDDAAHAAGREGEAKE